jgi:hypothetical protein
LDAVCFVNYTYLAASISERFGAWTSHGLVTGQHLDLITGLYHCPLNIPEYRSPE